MVRNSRSAEGGISFAGSGRVESSASLRALEVPTLILDGEVAIFDQKLISRFEWLRRRAPAEIATPHSSWCSTALVLEVRTSATARSTFAGT